MTKAEWSRYVAALATGIDYFNLKNAVAARQGPARAPVYGEGLVCLREVEAR